EPTSLTEHDRLGMLCTRLAVGLLDDVDAGPEPAVDVDDRPPGRGPHLHGLGDRLLDGVRVVEQLPGPPALAQVDPAEPDALDRLFLEPRQPGVVRLEVAGAAVSSRVLQPQLDVRRRVEHLTLNDERVAVVGEPALHALLPGPTAHD